MLGWLMHDADRAALLSLAAGFYVIVRGLDNLEKGLDKNGFTGTLLTKVPDEIGKQADNHVENTILSLKAVTGRVNKQFRAPS